MHVLGRLLRIVKEPESVLATSPELERSWEAVLDDLREAFEESWAPGSRVNLVDFVGQRLTPRLSDERRFSALATLAATELELRIDSGRPATAGEYLRQYPQLADCRPVAIELYVVEFRHRWQQEPEFDPPQFYKQVPKSLVEDVQQRLAPPERYERQVLVGTGGQGDAWQSKDRELQRLVAIKTLRAETASEEERQRLVSEARITSDLEHPGVVPVYSLEQQSPSGSQYAMRLVRGETLRSRIRDFHQQFCSSDQARPVAKSPGNEASSGDVGDAVLRPASRPAALRQLLNHFLNVCETVAFAHAHKRRYVHRDIKPDNIMVGDFGETIVMDWGCALATSDSADDVEATRGSQANTPVSYEELQRRCASTTNVAFSEGLDIDESDFWESLRTRTKLYTQHGAVVGTPGYMSPEQALGALGYVDVRSDVFCLGATLYEVLTGHPPYRARKGEHPQSVLERICAGCFPPPSTDNRSVDPTLAAICEKALAADSADRYQSAKALSSDLKKHLAGQETAARPYSGRERIWRWIQGHVKEVTIAWAVLLGLSIALWYSSQQRRDAERRQLVAQQRVDALLTADEASAPAVIAALSAAGQSSDSELQRRLALLEQDEDSSPDKLRRLRLAHLPYAPENLIGLVEGQRKTGQLELLNLANTRPSEFVLALRIIRRHGPPTGDAAWRYLQPQIEAALADETAEPNTRLAAACLMDAAQSQAWEESRSQIVAEALVRTSETDVDVWLSALGGELQSAAKSLRGIFRDRSQPERQQRLAAHVLGSLTTETAEFAELAIQGRESQLPYFAARMKAWTPAMRSQAVARLEEELAQDLSAVKDERLATALAKRQGAAAAILVLLDHSAPAWSILQLAGPDPRVRSFAIHRMRAVKAPAASLFRRLQQTDNDTEKHGLILALGEYRPDELLIPHQQLVDHLQQLYSSEPHAGVHAAAEWFLRHWSLQYPERFDGNWLATAQRQIAEPQHRPVQNRQWYVARLDDDVVLEMVVVRRPPDGIFEMGARDDGWKNKVIDDGDLTPLSDESLRPTPIDRDFAMGSKEVTRGLFELFVAWEQEHRPEFDVEWDYPASYSPTPASPAISVDWVLAARFCNWLSERARLQPYYEFDIDEDDGELLFVGRRQEADGYRLPSEAEWEYASRAGTVTRRFYGNEPAYGEREHGLLGHYANYLMNSPRAPREGGVKRPNHWGLFDTLGNVFEYCDYPPRGHGLDAFHRALDDGGGVAAFVMAGFAFPVRGSFHHGQGRFCAFRLPAALSRRQRPGRIPRCPHSARPTRDRDGAEKH